MRLLPFAALLATLSAGAQETAEVKPLGPRLERFTYPYPAREFVIQSQGHDLAMVYMDLTPPRANGRIAVLLHGKNFCGPYWIATAERLRDQGYRVVVPDQVGFCKSSKPRGYQYTLHQLAANTHALLQHLGVAKAVVIAHSMGGMVGVRYALMFPEGVEKLVLVDPIGLEDWKAKGVPWRSVDDWYKSELKTSFASIKSYQLKSYYDGKWKPDYDKWVALQAGMYQGEGREEAAWAGALTYDMIYAQPVLYEFPNLKLPVVLIIGQRDRTALGKDLAPPDVAAKLGNYPELGLEATKRIPGARLIPLDGLGHSPMIEAPKRFYQALDEAMGDRSAR